MLRLSTNPKSFQFHMNIVQTSYHVLRFSPYPIQKKIQEIRNGSPYHCAIKIVQRLTGNEQRSHFVISPVNAKGTTSAYPPDKLFSILSHIFVYENNGNSPRYYLRFELHYFGQVFHNCRPVESQGPRRQGSQVLCGVFFSSP